MGYDIHVVIQRQNGNIWETIPGPHPSELRRRDYDLFGILGNVRNGSGFAGVKTAEEWPSIAPDRGLPEGFIVDDNTDVGDHSFTFIYLNELQEFDWDFTVNTLYGIVPAKTYEELKGQNVRPSSYSGGISGPGIVTYEPSNYELAKLDGNLAQKPYVRMSWTESARSATYDWAGKVIPYLEKLADGKPLRLVMGFDS